jgi:hypothetical protein
MLVARGQPDSLPSAELTPDRWLRMLHDVAYVTCGHPDERSV